MTKEVSELLPVSPAVITWARERAGFSLEDASKYFRKIEAWERSEGAPTYPQLEQMAEKFTCPVAVFFFPNPPDVPSVESSFRTIAPSEFAEFPRNLRVLLRRAQAMQLNLGELNEGRNPAPRLITRDLAFSPSTSVSKIANEIRKYVGVSVEAQTGWSNVDEALETWRELFLQFGIYVFKDAFRVKRYFGFCLYDSEFPIIYVNNSSTKSRQIFTLFHELGHLLFHTSGIDITGEPFATPNKESQRIEVICNALAGDFLVPEPELLAALGRLPPNRNAAATLAGHFKVSREVIYRRFLDRGMIDEAEYSDAAETWNKQIKQRKAKSGNYYNTLFAYLGDPYINLAFRRYLQHRIDDTQLSEYLNIKPRNLAAFELKFAGGGR